MSGVSFYESWVYTGFNFILGLPIIFLGIQDRDLSAKFVCDRPEVYATGRTNVYLTVVGIAGWILNAVVYAVGICMLFYYAGNMSFVPLGLYAMGTTVFVGTTNALQWKCAYLFHQWDWIKFFLFIISIFGALAYFSILSVTLWEYWYEAHQLLSTAFFWFYGFFAIPFFVIFIDVFTYNAYLFFYPSKEMLYREVEEQVKQNNNSTGYNNVLSFKRDAQTVDVIPPPTMPVYATLVENEMLSVM